MRAQDVWSVFSPLAGLVPADSLNLGQGDVPALTERAHRLILTATLTLTQGSVPSSLYQRVPSSI